jgi:hypothetical protein
MMQHLFLPGSIEQRSQELFLHESIQNIQYSPRLEENSV